MINLEISDGWGDGRGDGTGFGNRSGDGAGGSWYSIGKGDGFGGGDSGIKGDGSGYGHFAGTDKQPAVDIGRSALGPDAARRRKARP